MIGGDGGECSPGRCWSGRGVSVGVHVCVVSEGGGIACAVCCCRREWEEDFAHGWCARCGVRWVIPLLGVLSFLGELRPFCFWVFLGFMDGLGFGGSHPEDFGIFRMQGGSL